MNEPIKYQCLIYVYIACITENMEKIKKHKTFYLGLLDFSFFTMDFWFKNENEVGA